jgi:2-keto-4-pentenoate hydratase
VTAPWKDTRVVTGLTHQLRQRQQMLDGGASAVGWKVGFGAPAALELMQITAPLLGFLTDAAVFESGATVDASSWGQPLIEFEVALYLGSDLGPGASDEEARSAISAVGAAIELANVDLPIGPEHVEEIVAGGIFHTGVIFGEPDEGRAGLDISGLTARVVIDGVERAVTNDLQAITGSYPRIVADVASTLAAVGETLRAGDVIITGSVIPPVPLGEGTEFEFALEPLPPISIRVG